jgi:hypothetical protein
MASGTKAAAEQAREDEEARRSAQAQIRQFPDPVLQQRAGTSSASTTTSRRSRSA